MRSRPKPAHAGSALVLVTNDDGVAAPGLAAMARALEMHASVVVVAPETERSACSHKLTLHSVLRIRTVSANWYALSGTPADCVYVALYAADRLFGRRPDLVVAGLNHGLNLGLDVYYSGTVAAAREAAIRGLPGLAVSMDPKANLVEAAAIGARLATAMLGCSHDAARPTVLNANIPATGSWRLRATRLGTRVYGEGVRFGLDPRGREYLWIGGPGVTNHGAPGTDTHAFDRGEIGVTCLPLAPSRSANERLVAQVLRKAAETRHERNRQR